MPKSSKRGPKKGSKMAKAFGAKGGKSRPSLKRGGKKVGARHARPRKK